MGLPWWLRCSGICLQCGRLGSIPGLGRSPGEGNGYPSSILVWRIPWTEEPGRLQSWGLRVRHWATSTPVLLPRKPHGWRSLVAAVHGVARSWMRLSNFSVNFHFHALEKEMATHSSVLAWRIPETGEPGGLPSLGSHRVGHDWSDAAAAALPSAAHWN